MCAGHEGVSGGPAGLASQRLWRGCWPGRREGLCNEAVEQMPIAEWGVLHSPGWGWEEVSQQHTEL